MKRMIIILGVALILLVPPLPLAKTTPRWRLSA